MSYGSTNASPARVSEHPHGYTDMILITFLGGKQGAVPADQAANLQPHLAHIKALDIRCQPVMRDAFQRLFIAGIPSLEELSLVVEGDDSPGGVSSSRRTPMFDLRAHSLPRLWNLRVRDAIVHLDALLCARLRFLHLEMSAGAERRLPPDNFLEIIHHSMRLERLTVERYVNVALSPPLPIVSLHRQSRLTHVKLVDSPQVVSKILSHLSFPTKGPTIDLIAVGLVRHDTPLDFRALLPRGQGQLPILQQAAFIRVRDTMDLYPSLSCLVSTARGSPGLDLALRATNGADSALAGRRDGALFRSMVQCLDIFQGSPVEEVQFCGKMNAVPQNEWARALDRFPSIRQIELWDVPKAPDDSFNALLAALASPSHLRWGEAVCAELDTLHISGTLRSTDLVRAIVDCVRQRAQKFGAPRPRELRVKLFPDHVWSLDQSKRCKEILNGGAHRVRLEIYSPGDDQAWIMQDDEDVYWRGSLKR